jgi:hypothetical protein
MRRFAWIPASLFMFLSFAAVAQDQQEELKGLYAAVALLNQEQQAVFQQFQMLQELRRANSETFFAGTLRSPRYATEVPNYADVVQYQKDVARRGEELADEAAQLYAQYAEIGARKTQLQQRIYELTLSKP